MLAFVAATALALAVAGVAGGATGSLTYKDCITGETESGPAGSDACVAIASAAGANSGLGGPSAVAVSPDGESLYALSGEDDAIAQFSRKTSNGKLTYEGCITGEAATGPTGLGRLRCDSLGDRNRGQLRHGQPALGRRQLRRQGRVRAR